MGSEKVPLPVEVVARLMPMEEAVAVMDAPGMTAPVESCTEPKMVPEVTWADAMSEPPNKIRGIASRFRRERGWEDLWDLRIMLW